jgi:O-antigen ligase
MVSAPMRRLAAAILLLLPAALTFGRGGYFAVARDRGAILAFLLLAVATVVTERPLPRSRAGRLALGGLAALTAWTGLSLLWAPLGGPAFADLERLALYTAALAAGIALLREIDYVEPVLLATTVAAAVYGLSARLVPSLVTLHPLISAGDRLAQPLTYWNAQGAMAAVGIALAAGLVAQKRFPRAAAACAPVLGLDVELTLSRGAIGAALAGLAIVVALAPTRRGLRAAAVVGGAAALAALASLALPAVQDAGGASGQGAAMIAVLAVLTAAAALAAGRDLRDRPVAAVRTVAVCALAVLVVGTVLAVARGGHRPLSSGTQRLVSVQSNRSAYWKVALRVFADHPLHGIGSGSFQVEWLKRRPFAESVRDAHSLYLETGAELGLVGLACLAVFLTGCGLAARRGPPAAVAALGAFALHAGIDWDWEMPALSLLAILLVARLAAAQER